MVPTITAALCINYSCVKEYRGHANSKLRGSYLYPGKELLKCADVATSSNIVTLHMLSC